jgi:hypothetical protein
MKAALRCYIDNNEDKKPPERPEQYYSDDFVFVFDTETTIDTAQDFLFGSCGIWKNGKFKEIILFHGNLPESKLNVLKEYATKHKKALLTKDEFIRLFYTYVLRERAVCVGFNLPFDLSRIANYFGNSKTKDAFSLKLTDNIFYPRVVIKHRDSKSSFIGFTKPYSHNRDKKTVYGGTFVDLRTLTFALTNESHTLESACELFNVPHKKIKVEEHGKITPEYIDYNIGDILATYDLYVALKKNFETYGLDKPLNMLWSPATIGKEYFKEMGIKQFGNQNPNFPKDMLGYIMSTYFGGRAEVHIRKKPVRITYLDFTSMYPSVLELQQLSKFMVADKIKIVEDKNFQKFLESVTLETFRDKKMWPSLTGLALVEPNKDVLPVRGKYGNKIVYNIGINEVSGKPCYWTYADIVASTIITGKPPKILKAYRFKPVGIQKGLKTINLFGKPLDPRKDSFIKTLIEHRMRVKEQLKTDPDNAELKNQEHIAKIIANSIGYGAYAEINTIPRAVKARIFGLKSFKTKADKTEVQGKAFNPLLATFITAGSRLILAMAEVFSEQSKGYFAYMDTDSIFVSPELEPKLQAFFKPLNPYNVDINMFKVEKTKNGRLLRNVLFYGISAKRYCLYDVDNNGEITILKHSSHGLGYISSMPKGWEEGFWKNIILYHDGKITRSYIDNLYKNRIVASKIAITSPHILKRFKRIYIDGRIKPFNFVIVGVGHLRDDNTNELVIPLVPYTKNYDTIPYTPFMDYKTGRSYTDNTQFYWKPISELFFDYIDHKEEKYDGDNGILRRRHVIIDDVEYIGKESNNLEESEIIGVQDDYTVIYKDRITDNNTDLTRIIMLITPLHAAKVRLSKRQLMRLRKKVRNGEPIKLRNKTVRKLLSLKGSVKY